VRDSTSAEVEGEAILHEHPQMLTAHQGVVDVHQVPLERIETPGRPARRFLGDIAALAESMQDFGLQQPISVRVDGDHFILTSGLRRLAAARLLRWSTIPAFVRNVSADQAYVLDLIENLQRQDLSPEEEADALGELIRTRGWTLQQVADTVKRSLGYVSKRVRLFEDDLLRDAVVNRGMPVSTAEELLSAPAEQRPELILRAIAERWDQVRAREVLRLMEQLARLNGGGPAESVTNDTPAPAVRDRLDDGDISSFDLIASKNGASVRPRGFTRAIREFHRLISDLHAADLTSSDRAALRALFRDLLVLARAPTRPAPPVFPPLPTLRRRQS
jgi:ParB family transcriptional regulator, chromosome partitioning protein